MKFNIGDRVASGNRKNHIKGVVTNNTSYGDLILIETDSGSFKKINQNELKLEKDFDENVSKIEEEFEKVKEEVSLKLKSAALLIDEASDLCKKVDAKLRDSEFCYDLDELMDSLSRAGWRTSSLYC